MYGRHNMSCSAAGYCWQCKRASRCVQVPFKPVAGATVAGATGQITLEVYDAHDHRVEVTLEVALTGGAAP